MSRRPVIKNSDTGVLGRATSTELSTEGAAELRQNELMCVAAGYSLPGDMLFKQCKFPEQIAQ